MSFWEIYLYCVIGIVISVLLPIVWQAVYRYFPKAKAAGVGGTLWNAVKPYLVLGAASLITGVLVVAFAGDTLADFKAALLAGYMWDSTLQKLRP